MILNLMGFANNYGPKYNTLNNYNIDLTTGKELYLMTFLEMELIILI